MLDVRAAMFCHPNSVAAVPQQRKSAPTNLVFFAVSNVEYSARFPPRCQLSPIATGVYIGIDRNCHASCSSNKSVRYRIGDNICTAALIDVDM